MRLFDLVHSRYVHGRRTTILSAHLARLIPPGASVIDIGAGDGLVARKLTERRPDLSVTAMEVLIRPDMHLAVEPFDGTSVPRPDGTFDVAVLVDVLHHAEDARALLVEARRVARSAVVVKDVMAEGVLSAETLHLMERLANTPHGISIPATFWSRREWESTFAQLDLRVDEWRDRLGLYPVPARFVFERDFHFIARLGLS